MKKIITILISLLLGTTAYAWSYVGDGSSFGSNFWEKESAGTGIIPKESLNIGSTINRVPSIFGTSGNFSSLTTSATSTGSKGWNLTGGCFAIDGTCVGGGSASSLLADWVKETNYGVLNLTASTSIPYWAKDTIYASSTSIFQGLATFGNATATQLSISGSTYLTGLGQGWLHTAGGTNALTASTSPTVNYITATSTTATSTFPKIDATSAIRIGSDYITDITGTNLSITDGVLNATGGSGVSDWQKETNYGSLTLTPTTTIPVWFKDVIYASSTIISQGQITMPNFVANSTIATSTITNALQIGGTAGDNALKMTAGRIYSNSTSVGGLVNLTNTSNTGAGLVAYTNAGASTGRLGVFRCDNVLFDQDCLNVSYDGTEAGLSVIATGGVGLSVSNSGNANHTSIFNYTGTGASQAAINAISSNPNFSAMGLTGEELAHGTLKVTHKGSGADANAAALSIDIYSTSTASAAQGMFITSSTGTSTGALIEARNNINKSLFTVRNDGRVGIADAGADAMLEIAPYTAGQPLLYVSSGANNDGDYMTILPNGLVGIGTTSPYQKLSVHGNVLADTFIATSTTATSTFAGPVKITANNSYGGNNDNEGLFNLSMSDSWRGSLLNIHASSTAQAGDGEMVRLEQYNANYANELLKIENKSTQGGSEEIMIVSGVPDIGMCDDTDSNNDCVEIEVTNHGEIVFNSRNSADNSFERNFNIAPARIGGMVEIGAQYDTPWKISKLTVNATSSLTNVLALSSSDTSTEGNLLTFTNTGRLGIGTTSPYSMLSVAGQVVAQNYVATSTTASSTLQNVNLNQLAFSDNSTQTLAYKATTTDVYIDCNMPQTGSEDFAPGGSWWQPIGALGAWAFQDATSSSVYCISHIPKNMADTPNASIWTIISATTSGTAILNIEATTTASGQDYNPASYTVLLNASTTAASRLVITGSANYQGTATSTSITNTLNAGDDLIIRYRRHGENVNDTVNNDIFMPQMWLRLDVN